MTTFALGFITRGLDKPGIEASIWVIASMIVIETLGIILMAMALLVRFNLGSRMLTVFANGQPHAQRKCILTLSIACLLAFDILTNVSSAFAGAGFLLIGALPLFIAYVACNRLAFAGLRFFCVKELDDALAGGTPKLGPLKPKISE